jgi:hypothetical protein
MPMKKLLFVLFVALAGCADTGGSNAEETNSALVSLNGTWRVVSFENYDENSVIYPTEENSGGYDITITFDESGDPYQLTGRNATNDIYGTFEYLSDNKVHVIHFTSSKVAQPELADEFSRALTSEHLEFEIVNGRLKLYYEEKDRGVTLVED